MMVSPPGQIAFSGSDPVHALLDRASEFTSFFQPVVSLSEGRAIGFEALLRLPTDCVLSGPGAAFASATGSPWLIDLEIAALESHLRAAVELPEGRLFLNLSPTALLDPRFRAGGLAGRIRKAGLSPEQVVVEISEIENVGDPEVFAAAIRPLRDEHFQLAIDDFGAGFANVRLLVELGPEFVKIDRALVTGAWQHPRKRVFLETLGSLGLRVNCSVIAEGVETERDLATVRACGIRVVQGYFTGCPAPAEQARLAPPLRVTGVALIDSPEETVGALALPRDGVGHKTRVGDLIPMFERQPEPAAIPVLEGSRVLGLVTQSILFFHLGHRYGHALWSDRAVSEFVEAHNEGFDHLSALSTLEAAAELIRRRPAWRRFDPLVVENETGGYHGLLPVDRLLGEMTRLKVEYALQSSPLTGLPGSTVLARSVDARLRSAKPFVVGWADLDDFKPFNDRYGFSRGDAALLLLAEILERHLQRGVGELVAHVGGDDFAFLIEPENHVRRAQAAAAEFSERVLGLYDPEDRLAGGIESVDRRGRKRRFGMTSVSVGLVAWNGEPGVNYRRLVEVAAEVKTAAKQTTGPVVLSNQRSLST
ncbi:MAG: GGDEF domain-containing protein [Vicinamibacteria bacterium]|nr:GGDEF domain-containing protein [Vicinamibacteria bacterium]